MKKYNGAQPLETNIKGMNIVCGIHTGSPIRINRVLNSQ